MNTDELEAGVTLSLLDRLTDAEPDSNTEGQLSSWEEVRQYKDSLCRDLAALLNTRRAEEDFDPAYEQATASLLTFGVIDFTSFNLKNEGEQDLVRRGVLQPKDVLGVVAGTRQASGSTNLMRLHTVTEQEAESIVHPKKTR